MTSPQDNLARANAALVKLRAALAENRVEEAVAFGQEAVGAAPRYLRAISGLVTALKRAGRYEEARGVLGAVPSDVSGSPADLLSMAKVCLREGLQQTAKEMLRRALESDPTNQRTAELLASTYYGENDFAAVVAVAEPFRMRGDPTPALLRSLAAAYEQLGDLASAADCAQLYCRAAPLDAHGHYHLATIEHRAGNIREALERYQFAIELSAGDVELQMSAADGIRALDARQLRQIAALASSDSTFRIALGRDPQMAIEERGFALSEEGLAVLASLDLDAVARDGPGPQGYGYH